MPDKDIVFLTAIERATMALDQARALLRTSPRTDTRFVRISRALDEAFSLIDDAVNASDADPRDGAETAG